MRILHYSLGFPPYRTGGLTKFCMDLMLQQRAEGHETALLWPGELRPWHKRIKFRYKLQEDGIGSIEIINPLPVSYDEGILNISAFTAEGSVPAYRVLLDAWQPDVIHVHTLMGMHKALLIAAKEKGIRLVFTTHDFFPVCSKVTMFRHGGVCREAHDCRSCPGCNMTALPLWKIWLLQTPLYRGIKDKAVVKRLRRRHREAYLSKEEVQNGAGVVIKNTAEDYLTLRSYYTHLIQMMDCVHFNSSLTHDVYAEFLGGLQGVVLPITHFAVKDRRRVREYGEKLRLTYLGSPGGGKGFDLLRESLDQLWKENVEGKKKNDFELNIYFTPAQIQPYMKVHDRYAYDGLEEIFDRTDVLIAPSIWQETFGYTVLEALSFGVPVIISDKTGVKDIVPEGTGIVINGISREKLCMVLRSITPELLREMNKNIQARFRVPKMEEMSKRLYEKCYIAGDEESV